MTGLAFVLFWLPVAFAVLVAASYVGTTIALRAYFDDESFRPRDAVRLGDENNGG